MDTLTPQNIVAAELLRIKRLIAMDPKFTTQAKRTERLAICAVCPKYKVLVGNILHVCRECNCVLEAKTWLANANCPLKKW